MIRNKMAQTLQAAVKFVEQGHVRVGPELVTDPAYLVTRRLEDYEDYNINSHNFKIGIYLVTGLISFNGFKLQKRL